MKFKDSLLKTMLMFPVRAWKEGFYNFLLCVPIMVFVLTVGVLFAVVVDFIQILDFEDF